MSKTITALLFVIAALFLNACTPILLDPAAVQIEPTPQLTPMVIENSTDVPRIPVDEAKQHFDNGTAIFVDSRSSNDYENKGHITNAIHLTDSMLFSQKAIFDTLGTELPKDQLIITYCT